MFLSVWLLLSCWIQFSYTHSYECPQTPKIAKLCSYQRLENQCETDSDCELKEEKCCKGRCGALQCLAAVRKVETTRPGVCPAFKDFTKDCYDVESNCKTDTECSEDGQKCCPGKCGSRDCKVAITGDRPGCPPINPDIRCIVYNQQCNSDNDCDKGEQCCFQPSCGTSCQKRAVPIPDPRPQCPPYGKDVKCIRYYKQCLGDKDCKYGQICCPVACGTACKSSSDPVCKPVSCRMHCEFGFQEDGNGCKICKCKPSPCPLLRCVPVPEGVCSRDSYGIIDGVKCLFCPQKIPCNEDCLLPKKAGPCDAYFPRYYYDTEKGSCQKFIYGGCKGNENNFKSLDECERKCNTEPEEPECPPLCEIACKYGNVLDKNGCPICQCKPDPCQQPPPCAPPPPNACTEPAYRIIEGVKCPWCYKIVPCKPNCENGKPLPHINCGRAGNRQDCPPEYYCNIDLLDRFAVCCPDKKPSGPPPSPPPSPQKKCPADPLPNAKCYQHTRICTDNSDCEGQKRCCRYGCYYKCLDPL